MEKEFIIDDMVEESIVLALVELMKDRKIGQITVSDIVKKAGVGRSSFYRHFSCKEDVLTLYVQQLFRDTSTVLEDEDIRDYIVRKFTTFKANKDLFKVLRENNMLSMLYGQALLETRMNIAFKGRYKNPYQAAFFSGAAVSVIIQWAENDFKEEEQQLADMFIFLMDGHHRDKN